MEDGNVLKKGLVEASSFWGKIICSVFTINWDFGNHVAFILRAEEKSEQEASMKQRRR
jgi:hypothetical protein